MSSLFFAGRFLHKMKIKVGFHQRSKKGGSRERHKKMKINRSTALNKNTMVQLIKSKMKELEFSPKKFLGQCFLINPQVIKDTILAVENLSPSLIMEVGPGLGALTDELILLKRPFCAVERDSVLYQYWKDKGVCVLEGDILKLPWPTQLLPGSVLAGNLSYRIASRLVVQCCPGPDKLKAMVLMLQKEVAQRILSPPRSKSYSILSVLSRCFWEVHILTEACVSDFYPRPKVAGQVLVFRRKKHFIRKPEEFLLFVKMCFSQRRKFLLSQLKKTEGDGNICDIFSKMNVSKTARAEELSPEQFVCLFSHLERAKQKKKNFGLVSSGIK